eukprot:349682-Chlamydomonas_euryale.AAC.24
MVNIAAETAVKSSTVSWQWRAIQCSSGGALPVKGGPQPETALPVARANTCAVAGSVSCFLCTDTHNQEM